MASTPAIATGVNITAAGAGGALTGANDLSGVFGALMGGSAAGAATGAVDAPDITATGAVDANTPLVGAGMISVLLGQSGGTTGTAALQMGSLNNLFMQTMAGQATTQTEVKLGDAPALTVTGDADAVAAFVAQVQDVYQKMIVDGNLTIGQLSDSKELAGALTKLGMDPADATGVAERIQTMLKLLGKQQKVDDATAGALAAMMVAVMGQAQPAPTTAATTDATPQLGLQILSVEQQPAGSTGTAAMSSWQMSLSGDVTRDLLGLNSGKNGDTKTAASDAVVAGADKNLKVEVAVTTDADASVGLAMPALKTSHAAVKPVAIDTQPSDAAQAAAAVTTTGAAVKVAADEVLNAPKGDTYYKLQADKNGVETLEAVKPAADVKDAAINLAQQASQPVQVNVAGGVATSATADAASFAARVAQVHDMLDKAQVGQQVAVQIQPLLAAGGGTIRMNLHPKDLGQVTIELQVMDGKVHGSIAASDPAVVEQLARDLHSLRHGLADAGLKLGEQGINLMLSNQGQQNPNGQNGQNNQAGQQAGGFGRGANTSADTGTTGTDTELATNLASWVAPDRVLDLSV